MNYLEIIEDALKRVREKVMETYPPKDQNTTSVNAFGDIQYRLDRIAEESLISSIKPHLPDCSIISEESGIIDGKSNRQTVIMDPLDGSVNAMRGIPFFSATLAIADGKNFSDIVSAGVMDLLHDDLFLSDGFGATLNGISIRPSNERDPDEAVISFDIKMRNAESESRFRNIGKFMQMVKSPRTLGSAALETVYVGAGRLDAYLAPSKQLRTFDCLPSLFIAKSAGAVIEGIDMDLNTVSLFERGGIAYLASSTKDLMNWMQSTL